MGPLEREHWSVLREVAPDVPELIGPQSAQLLDGGEKLDIAGASGGFYRTAFPALLWKHLASKIRRAPGR